MEVSVLVDELSGALKELVDKGQENVPIKNLQKYLDEVSKEDTIDESQAIKHFEENMEVFKANNAIAIESFRSTVEAGLSALKSALIINGAAAIALLAFIGNLSRNGDVNNGVLSGIGYALMIFVLGTGFAGTATGVRYLSQHSYDNALNDDIAEKKSCWKNVGHGFNIVSIFLALLSFASFFYGGWLAYQALIN